MRKKKDSDKPATPDIIWKLMIQKFFVDFLKLFKPDLLKDIIVEKTEFLEKELLSLTGKIKKGIVDVLAKVYLKNGLEEYLLFHIEVQGNSDENFLERMYGYYIRIWDKFKRPIISLALIVGIGKRRLMNNKYKLESYGTKLYFEFNAIDVSKLNYKKSIKSENPVEVAISILINTKEVPKWLRKSKALERLNQLGLDQEGKNILLAFVDRLLTLSDRDIEKFKEYIIKEAKEVKMILTSWEEKGMKKGRKEGFEKGIEKGIEKGRAEGIEKEKIADIKKLFRKGFSIDQISDLLEVDKNYAEKAVVNDQ